MRVMLVNAPPYKIQEPFYDTPPYPRTPLAMLAAYLRREGVDVGVLDCKFDRLDYSRALAAIREFAPNVVGFTAFSNEIIQAARLATMVKQSCAEVHTIIGGVHITALPEMTLREFPCFDYGVVGEGEITLLELVQALQSEPRSVSLLGVCRIDEDGRFHYGGERSKIDDLDSLPLPAWDLFRPAGEYHLQTSRGCPYHCIFCMNPNGRKVRVRNAENVLAEIGMILDLAEKPTLGFGDEVFTIYRERSEAICRGIVERGYRERMNWWAMAHAKFMDYDRAKMIKEAGCIRMGIGAEAGSDERLREIGKGATTDDIRRATSDIHRAGLTLTAYFILGLPNETVESAKQTIDFAVEINAQEPVLGIMVPYPGTKIGDMALRGEGGYLLRAKDWNDFNKQIGDAVEFRYVRRKTIERLQLMGYVKVFLRNGRFWEFMKFSWRFRRVAWTALWHLLRRRNKLVGRNKKQVADREDRRELGNGIVSNHYCAHSGKNQY